MGQLATISQQTLPVAHNRATEFYNGMTITVPSDPARNRSSSHQRAKSHSPEKVEQEDTPVRHASQPVARRIRGKSRGQPTSPYVDNPGASSSGPAPAAEEPRGRSTTAAPFP